MVVVFVSIREQWLGQYVVPKIRILHRWDECHRRTLTANVLVHVLVRASFLDYSPPLLTMTTTMTTTQCCCCSSYYFVEGNNSLSYPLQFIWHVVV
jgi:hypothetical protein